MYRPNDYPWHFPVDLYKAFCCMKYLVLLVASRPIDRCSVGGHHITAHFCCYSPGRTGGRVFIMYMIANFSLLFLSTGE